MTVGRPRLEVPLDGLPDGALRFLERLPAADRAGQRGAVGRVSLVVRLLLDHDLEPVEAHVPNASITHPFTPRAGDRFLDELAFLGIASRSAFVREPEGDGCAERFIRTPKRQLLWVQAFGTVEELRLALLVFYPRRNQDWLIEPNGQQTSAFRR